MVGGRHQGVDSGYGVVRLGAFLGSNSGSPYAGCVPLARHLSVFICKVETSEYQPHRQWHEAKGALNSRTLTCGVCWFPWR